MPENNLSPLQQSAKSALLLDILSSLDSLDQICNNDPDISRQMQELAQDDLNSHMSQLLNSSANFNVPTTPITSAQKFTNIEKWNLKFTGELKQMSVHNFLERVTELCESRHVSKQQVFESAVDLFAGKALTWYRANKHRVHDWNSLTNLLKVHFEPPDYRSRLFREILERTQDTSESIVEYLSCMQALFRRYGGLSETAQLDILVRNLSPFYATQLPVVASMSQLEEECLRLEIKKYRSDNYVPPSRRKNQFVEPDFAFVGAETTHHHVTSLRPETPLFASECTPSAPNNICPLPSNVNTVETSQNFSRSVTCWNCNRAGHRSRDCREPRNRHCFRCGAPGVTVHN